MSKKGGYYCAFKNCRGLSRRDKRSFFRFPKDPQRSKQWVRACDRGDLLEKTPLELFNSYRVCAKHFADTMFLNDLRNRLQPNSVPMQLEPPEETAVEDSPDQQLLQSDTCHQDTVAKLLGNCILQKISADEFFKATGIRINEPAPDECPQNTNQHPSPDHIYSSKKSNNNNNNATAAAALAIDIDNDNPSNFSIEALSYHDLINSLPTSLINAPGAESPELPDDILDDLHQPMLLGNITNAFDSLEAIRQADDRVRIKEACTQTEDDEDSACCDNDYGVSVESTVMKPGKRTGKHLRGGKGDKAREVAPGCRKGGLESVTLEQYELLTERFFPRETSEFIKVQAQLFKKKTADREYSPGFKRQCLALFLAGPRTYKNLQKLFCLPGVRDLQTLKY
ncbi:uncharacterized protein LOC106643068 [Copidosoma floridanum]|uniref:uncharacterized protein LOC106643068 n=1 Tax=Copidosoma floridanum TaxID=29053 RepID=UPI0006C9910A|nr:uncharacterized protein LOC106643068 [Copidosoma floridanum]